MRVVTVIQSGGGGVGAGRRTRVIVGRSGPQGPAGGGGGGGATTLDELTDVALVGTTSGDFLRYSGTEWTDTKITAGDLGTGTADAFHFLGGDLTWQDAVPLDVGGKNTTASTIAKGTPVYVTGSVGAGATVEVAPADATSAGTMPSIGLTTTDLAAGATGYVRVMGVLSGVSTGSYSINQTLYVASGGGLTSSRPTGSTTLVQNIGKVIRSNNNTGEILVMGPGRSNDVPNLIGTGYLASSGTASATTFLRGDQSWSGVTAANVSGLAAVATTGAYGDLSGRPSLAAIATSGSASDLTTGTVPSARLATSGTASSTTALRGDQTWGNVPSGNAANPTVTSGTYLDGSTGLLLYGLAGNYASAPDIAAYTPTNIEVVVQFSTDSVAGGAKTIASKRTSTAELEFSLDVDGTSLRFRRSYNGTTWAANVTSSAFLSAGTTYWIKVTHNPTTGATEFYSAANQATEPSSWTARGSTTSTTGTPYNGTGTLNIGSPASIELLSGTIRRFIVRSDVGGSVVFDANFAAQTADALAFTESSSNAATVSVTTTRYGYAIPGAQFVSASTAAISANTVYYAPFEVTAPIVVDMMAAETTTGPASSANLRMGVYAADSNLQPTGAALVDTGAIVVGVGVQAIFTKQVSPVTLTPGMYVTALNSSVALTLRTLQGGVTSTVLGASPLVAFLTATQTNGAWPTPGTTWTSRTVSSANTQRHLSFLRYKAA